MTGESGLGKDEVNAVSVFDRKNCADMAPGFQFSRFANLAPYPPPAGGLSTPGPSIHQWILDSLFLAVLLQKVVQSGDRQGVQRRVGLGRARIRSDRQPSRFILTSGPLIAGPWLVGTWVRLQEGSTEQCRSTALRSEQESRPIVHSVPSRGMYSVLVISRVQGFRNVRGNTKSRHFCDLTGLEPKNQRAVAWNQSPQSWGNQGAETVTDLRTAVMHEEHPRAKFRLGWLLCGVLAILIGAYFSDGGIGVLIAAGMCAVAAAVFDVIDSRLIAILQAVQSYR